jgi:hypothetical protein
MALRISQETRPAMDLFRVLLKLGFSSLGPDAADHFDALSRNAFEHRCARVVPRMQAN